MDQRHAEYAAYYRARATRYQDRPLYQETARAEAAMADSIEAAPSLEDWGPDMLARNLNVACAVALARDQARADAGLYTEIEEPVRAAGPQRVLAELTSAEGLTAADVPARVAAILNQNSRDITVDELVRVFEGALDILEEIEVTETADVPAEWRADWAGVVADNIERGRQSWQADVLPQHRLWDPAWDFDERLVWQARHRRRIPLPDAVVTRRLEQYRRYTGRA